MGGGSADHPKRTENSPRLAVKCTRATGTFFACLFRQENPPRGTGRIYERASDPKITTGIGTWPPQLCLREHQYCISTTRYCYGYCNHYAIAVAMQ